MTPARVVSVDLAYRRKRDIGVCVLTQRARGVDAEFMPISRDACADPPSPAWVANACARIARECGARLLLLDGPQAWKEPANRLAHSRVCEHALHTPAKTGEPGHVKPRPYTAFVAFSIEVFDALHARGWPRLETARPPRSRRSLEVFPHAAWKRLGFAPLPAKRKCAPQQLAAAYRTLCEGDRVRANRTPTHDELQALIAGLPGLALLARDSSSYELLGACPTLKDGHWREGFILAPRSKASGLSQTPAT